MGLNPPWVGGAVTGPPLWNAFTKSGFEYPRWAGVNPSKG